MASGVTVQDSCIQKINEMKRGKNPLTALIMKLSDDNREIVVDQECGLDKTLEDIKRDYLKNDTPAYILYDSYHRQKVDSMAKRKLQLIVWCPDTCKVKQKMLIASSKDALKKKIEGVAEKDWQWCDDESAMENIKEQMDLKNQCGDQLQE
ncbi:hypothetical protein KUTeg_014074 [Tegillarca granosa]|uniref:ADF-H domain-containing protein n=1 Tax=Tegillarca granosa TaxID=220873 RepID=A0ABQ9EVJ5_TEGGR|nr:hypothetical protein KUTeg_014074 [Tegillarca granosa]